MSRVACIRKNDVTIMSPCTCLCALLALVKASLKTFIVTSFRVGCRTTEYTPLLDEGATLDFMENADTEVRSVSTTNSEQTKGRKVANEAILLRILVFYPINY